MNFFLLLLLPLSAAELVHPTRPPTQNKSQGAQRKTHLVPDISGRKAPNTPNNQQLRVTLIHTESKRTVSFHAGDFPRVHTLASCISR